MQIRLTEDDIKAAFDKLNATLEDLLDAQEEHDNFKAQIEIDKNRAISRGIEGSNEATRKANLELMFEHEYEHLKQLQKNIDKARLLMDKALNDCSAIRNIIRLYEVAAALESK